MKAAYKWRIQNGLYAYITDEIDKGLFVYNTKTYEREYEDGTVETGSSVNDGTIASVVSKMTKQQYIDHFNTFKNFMNKNYPDVSLLDVSYYYNIENDECSASAGSLKCAFTDIIFRVSGVTIGANPDVILEAENTNPTNGDIVYNMSFVIPATVVSGESITFTSVTANTLVTSSITADNITVNEINVTNVTTENLTANTIVVTSATINELNTSAITVSSITAGDITVSSITASSITAGDITASSITVSGSVIADSFVKSGGTGDEYLMADGSVTRLSAGTNIELVRDGNVVIINSTASGGTGGEYENGRNIRITSDNKINAEGYIHNSAVTSFATAGFVDSNLIVLGIDDANDIIIVSDDPTNILYSGDTILVDNMNYKITEIFTYTEQQPGTIDIGDTPIRRSPVATKQNAIRVSPNLSGTSIQTGSTICVFIYNDASGTYSFAEGQLTESSGDYGSHAEGYKTEASGDYGSHAEGYKTTAIGNYSHAEGYETEIGTYKEKVYSLEGITGWAKYDTPSITTHVVLYITENNSLKDKFKKGEWIKLVYNNQYEEDILIGTVSSGGSFYIIFNSSIEITDVDGLTIYYKQDSDEKIPSCGHAGGQNTISNLNAMTAIGRYNETGNTGELFVVGNGYEDNRSNAFVIQGESKNTALATVDGIKNVSLGVPIGSMTMWMGVPINDENKYNLRKDEECGLPEGWILAKGGSIRLRYIGKINSENNDIYKYKNETDYVYIPRYNTGSTIDTYSTEYDFTHFDKFELVGYRSYNGNWVTSDSGTSYFTYSAYEPANSLAIELFYDVLSTSDKINLTRLLNHIILYTKVYVLVDSSPRAVKSYIKSNEKYFTQFTNTKYYLETLGKDPEEYVINARHVISWYSNPIEYERNDDYAINDDILITMPDMSERVPLGASYDDGRNFGNNKTCFGTVFADYYNNNNANLCAGSTGGEQEHTLIKKEIPNNVSQGAKNGVNSWSGSSVDGDPHNNIPPFLALNFIIKYK